MNQTNTIVFSYREGTMKIEHLGCHLYLCNMENLFKFILLSTFLGKYPKTVVLIGGGGDTCDEDFPYD